MPKTSPKRPIRLSVLAAHFIIKEAVDEVFKTQNEEPPKPRQMSSWSALYLGLLGSLACKTQARKCA
jgi:hypothetical protein